MKYLNRLAVAMILALMSIVGAPNAFAAESCADKPPVNIGWVAWTENEFEAKLVRQLIEENYGCEVELTLTNIAFEYQGVANGDLDLMLEAWFPDNHRAYWEEVATSVWDVGPLFLGGMNGWIVPDYVPESELGSIEDLKKPEIAAKVDHKIVGIDPGAGLMQLSEKALQAYGLEDYTLVESSGAGMTSALSRAIQNKEWIVVTGWTPHWMFSRWNLRFLEDPKLALGGPQHSDIIVREGFYQDYPKVFGMLSRMMIPLDMLQDAMLTVTQTSYEQAVDEFIKNHPDLVHYWITGDMPGKQPTDSGITASAN